MVSVHSTPHALEQLIRVEQPGAEQVPVGRREHRLAIGDQLIGQGQEAAPRHDGAAGGRGGHGREDTPHREPRARSDYCWRRDPPRRPPVHAHTAGAVTAGLVLAGVVFLAGSLAGEGILDNQLARWGGAVVIFALAELSLGVILLVSGGANGAPAGQLLGPAAAALLLASTALA